MEAEIYVFLLTNQPMTAYAVGRAIGKATANVYKGVEALSRLGAVMVEEGESRACRAVPVTEFLAHRERQHRQQSQQAAAALASLQKTHYDERVYRIEQVDEVLERARGMLAQAQRVAIIDAFPGAMDRIASAIRAAVARGVDVRVQAYGAVTLDGADVVQVAAGAQSVAYWNAEQINVVVDGSQMLFALLGKALDRVHHAIWSHSLYLACMAHGGLQAEHTLHRLKATQEKGSGVTVASALDRHRFFIAAAIPGQMALAERLSTAAPAKSTHVKDATSE